MIRTSKHYFHEPNKNKTIKLNEFVSQYKESIQYFIDYIWNNLIDQNLNSPNMISTKGHNYKDLSQRALKCSATQACSIIKGTLDLQRRRMYVLNKLNPNTKEYIRLKELIDKQVVSKPIANVHCELNSICIDIKDNFIQLKSIGKYFGKIRIPFKYHKQSNKWMKLGKLMTSFLLSNKWIDLRWIIENQTKLIGKTIGIDQGINTCLSLSDNQTTKPNNHGYDLNKILSILSRKKKGSKAFKRTQAHRTNYINWSINQLNFNNIKCINIENVMNIRKGKNICRKLSHWTYTLINSKLENLCEELGVHVSYHKSNYRSQRCSQCGFVLKSNRNKKVFCCKKCGYTDDSDVNASKNHEVELPYLPLDLSQVGLNNSLGFYWNINGLFDIFGNERTVRYTNKT